MSSPSLRKAGATAPPTGDVELWDETMMLVGVCSQLAHASRESLAPPPPLHVVTG